MRCTLPRECPRSIFLEAPGADILGAVPWGTVSFLGTLPARTIPPGDYEITVTAAGNRTNVLLRSGAFGLGAPESTAFVITPLGGEGLTPISVVGINSGGGVLTHADAPAAVRVINGAADGAPRDVAFGGEFNPPLFSAAPFAVPTTYAQRAPGTEVQVNVTPAGNPGVLEVDQKVNLTATRKHTLLINGPTGTLTLAYTTDDDRRLVKGAQLRSYNAASQFTALDFLVIPADVDPTAAGAVASLFSGHDRLATKLSAGRLQRFSAAVPYDDDRRGSSPGHDERRWNLRGCCDQRSRRRDGHDHADRRLRAVTTLALHEPPCRCTNRGKLDADPTNLGLDDTRRVDGRGRHHSCATRRRMRPALSSHLPNRVHRGVDGQNVARLAVAPTVRVTSNGAVVDLGKGQAWGPARRLSYRQTFVDPVTGAAVFYGVVTNVIRANPTGRAPKANPRPNIRGSTSRA